MKKRILASIVAAVVILSIPQTLLAEARLDGEVTAVSPAGWHTMIIDKDNVLWGVGANHRGQLGDGTTTDRTAPVKVMENIVDVSATGARLGSTKSKGAEITRCFTLAVDKDGILWGWGSNDYGQLGDGTTTDRLRPVKIMENIVDVDAGWNCSMAIDKDGGLWVWGDNFATVFSFTNKLIHPVPKKLMVRPVKIMNNVVAISAGTHHIMAIDKDGVLWGWGENEGGRIGDGTTTDRLDTPVRVMENVAAVSTRGKNTMAITRDGVLWGWGRNEFGEVGDGTRIQRLSPVKIMEDVASVSTGASHTIALTKDGQLFGWGNNLSDEISHNIQANGIQASPFNIQKGWKNIMRADRVPANVSAINAGDQYTMVITDDGQLWGWGNNSLGQIGAGKSINSIGPVKVMDGVKTPAIAKKP